MRTPTFEKKISDPNFFLLLFRLFLSEILSSRRCRLSRTTSNPAKKCGKIQAKVARFPAFLRQKNYWHYIFTPFSTFANIKGSLPTESTTLDRLRCRTKTDGEYFPGFWPIRIHFNFSNDATSSKISFSKGPASSGDLHPKRSP